MTSINIIEKIAHDVSSSGAQEKAVLAGLHRYQELVLTGERDDGQPSVEQRELALSTDYVVFVLNGSGYTAAEVVQMRSFLREFAAKGSLTIVTVGRMGVEVEAAKLAKALKVPHLEIGCVWQRPNGDGSTTRVPAARQVRNRQLGQLAAAYMATGGKAAVLRYGEEPRADSVEGLLVAAGAQARPGSHHFVTPVVHEVSRQGEPTVMVA